MAKITQEYINKKIDELLNPDMGKPSLPKLLEYLATQSNMNVPSTGGAPESPTAPAQPTMPNIAGRQQLMETNTIAQRYPYLGVR